MQYSNFLKSIFCLFIFSLLAACGGGVGTTPPSESEVVQPGATVFHLGGDFPADIDIVDQPDLKDTAFITLTEPAAVIAVDLDKVTLNKSDFHSEVFKGLSNSNLNELGFPNSLFVVDSAHAFLLTAVDSQKSFVVYFNPTNSFVYQKIPLGDPLTLSNPLKQVDGNGNSLPDISGSVLLSYPGSLVVDSSHSKLMISFSNLYYNQNLEVDHAIQGVVRFFDIQGNSLAPSSTPYLATACGADPKSGFNATGLTPLLNGQVLVTCTGVTKRNEAKRASEPVTYGGIDLINPKNPTTPIASLDLGLTAPGFREWAVRPDGMAYIGSSTYGYLLGIKINFFSPPFLTKIYGDDHPILVNNGKVIPDYINDLVLNFRGDTLYAMSFNQNSVYKLSLVGAEPQLLPDFIDLSFKTSLGGVSGAGPAALRPGSPGTNFTGADLFVLTGHPGTMVAIKTY